MAGKSCTFYKPLKLFVSSQVKFGSIYKNKDGYGCILGGTPISPHETYFSNTHPPTDTILDFLKLAISQLFLIGLMPNFKL